MPTLWTTSRLTGLVLMATTALGADVDSLVTRLGAPRFADREAAAAQLVQLGDQALPALRAAREVRDPEVRSRAARLLDGIEQASLTLASSIQMKPGRRSRAEIVSALAATQGLPLQFDDSGSPRASTPSVLEFGGDKVTFWQALERLGLDTRPRRDGDTFSAIGRLSGGIRLVPRSRLRTAPFLSGPFRVISRETQFSAEVNPFGDRGRERDRVELDLLLPLEVTAEPRLSIKSTGPIHLYEAIDDEDRPFTPAPSPVNDNLNPTLGDRDPSRMVVNLRLRRPGGAGKTLKKLRGAIPAEVEARRSEATIVPISLNTPIEMKPFVCGGVTVQVHGVTAQLQRFRPCYDLEMTIRAENWSGIPIRGFNRRSPDVTGTDYEIFWQNLAVVDAQGRSFVSNPPRTAWDASGIRVHLELPVRDEGASPPAAIKFYDTIRKKVEIPFRFVDVPLP